MRGALQTKQIVQVWTYEEQVQQWQNGNWDGRCRKER